MSITFTIGLALCLAGLLLRDTYEILKQSGRVDSKNKAVFCTVFAAMCGMLGSWPVMSLQDPWRIALPEAVRWAGGIAVVAAVFLAIGGVAQLRGLENIDHLVTTGLYSRLRHPMYTGFILWIMGWVLLGGAFASTLPAAACIGSILWWRRLEERALIAQFGTEYRSYSKHTWC